MLKNILIYIKYILTIYMNKKMNDIISDIEEVIQWYIKENKTNEQEFLNFLDAINKLSVSY